MTDKNNKNDITKKEYEELIIEIKKELPNIVLPSMGKIDSEIFIDINGKDFILGNKEV